MSDLNKSADTDSTETISTVDSLDQLNLRKQDYVSDFFIIKLVFALVLLLGVSYVLLRVFREKIILLFQKKEDLASKRSITKLETMRISPVTRVHLISVDDEKYLVSESTQHVSICSLAEGKGNTNVDDS